MDWSDSAVEANHRVCNLQTMPSQLLGWDKPAHAIDAWMLARLRQRVQQWSDAWIDTICVEQLNARL